jgi:methionine sulfoxide reductase heme-binding subunit
VDHLNRLLKRAPAWPLYMLCAAHVFWLFYLGLTGGLGVEPIKALEHAYGEAGLKLLVVTLAVTPLRRFSGVNLLKFRRALGLCSFFYIAGHLSVWLVLDVQQVGQIWADIVKRPYITVGMAGFALLLPLALTSNNASIRRMGAASWRKLHKLTYLAAILGAVHYVMLVKGFQIEPIVYLAVILGLIGSRFIERQRKIA